MCTPLFNHLKELYSHPKLKGFRRAKSRWISNHHHYRLYRSILPYNITASIFTNKYINQILAFIAGWVLSDLKYTVYVGLSGTTLAFLAVVPHGRCTIRIRWCGLRLWRESGDQEGEMKRKKQKGGHIWKGINCMIVENTHGCWTVANMLPPSLCSRLSVKSYLPH